MYTVSVITVSDTGFEGKREDVSGREIRRVLEESGYRVVSNTIVPDDLHRIAGLLERLADVDGVDLVVTTGGTGVSPRDLTPEATSMVIEKSVPGIPEAMRAAGFLKTPRAILSRGITGIRNKTLIINLPGSPKGAVENLSVVLSAIPHALDKIKGDISECASR
ncbi:MAG: MogA/MoaB family molybdenum cofactor biosynthesis protein [Pseudomonadota bacterium]